MTAQALSRIRSVRREPWLITIATTIVCVSILILILSIPVSDDYALARVFGWGGLAVSAGLVVQGFWKARRDEKFVSRLRGRETNLNPDEMRTKYHGARIVGWRIVHIVVAIALTGFAIAHGLILIPSIAGLLPSILVGVAGLAVLLIVGGSGVVAEKNRAQRRFGPLKKVHLWIMVMALTLIELHTVSAGSTIGVLGRAFTSWMLIAVVIVIGIGVEYGTLKWAHQGLRNFLFRDSVERKVDLGRRAALQKLGTAAIGTLVAVSFAEIALIIPKLQSIPVTQTGAQISVQTGGGAKLANLSQIPYNAAYLFNYPQNNPNILIRLKDGTIVAYSATCTHAPCTVAYDPTSSLIICPCHHALFDPANQAKVLGGPAPYPLPSVRLSIDQNGDIWLS